MTLRRYSGVAMTSSVSPAGSDAMSWSITNWRASAIAVAVAVERRLEVGRVVRLDPVDDLLPRTRPGRSRCAAAARAALFSGQLLARRCRGSRRCRQAVERAQADQLVVRARCPGRTHRRASASRSVEPARVVVERAAHRRAAARSRAARLGVVVAELARARRRRPRRTATAATRPTRAPARSTAAPAARPSRDFCSSMCCGAASRRDAIADRRSASGRVPRANSRKMPSPISSAATRGAPRRDAPRRRRSGAAS